MESGYQKANALFQKYAGKLTLLPCVDPHYVLIDAKRDQTLEPVFFTYEEAGEFYYHGLHKSKIAGTDYYDFQSPYGYGGAVATTTDPHFLRHAWEAYLQFSREQNVVVEFIRFHPLLKNWQFYHGDVMFNRDTVWIDLTVDDLIASYQQNRVRTAVRKGIKNNVETRFLDKTQFLSTFKKIYKDSMQRLNANNFYVFNDDYIDALCAWENAYLAASFYEDKIVAVLISMILGDVVELHLFGSTDESRKSSATNLIYHHTFEMAKAKGCRTVHFGGGTSNDLNDPLLFFKLGYSDKTAQYKIGKFVHDVAAYQKMQCAWREKTGEEPKRILFYKD